MLAEEYIFYLCMYIINIRCICKNKIANLFEIWSAIIRNNTQSYLVLPWL